MNILSCKTCRVRSSEDDKMDDDHVCVTITVKTVNVHIFAVFVSWLLVRCLVVCLFVATFSSLFWLLCFLTFIKKKTMSINQLSSNIWLNVVTVILYIASKIEINISSYKRNVTWFLKNWTHDCCLTCPMFKPRYWSFQLINLVVLNLPSPP